MIVVNQSAESEAETFSFRFYVRFQEVMFKADFKQHAAHDEDLFDKKKQQLERICYLTEYCDTLT